MSAFAGWLTRGRALLLTAIVVLAALCFVQSVVLGLLLAVLMLLGIAFRVRERWHEGRL